MKKIFLTALLLFAAPAFAVIDAPKGTGTVIRADNSAHTITIKHAPIPSLGWGEMTMAFEVLPSIDLTTIKPGDKVAFTLKPEEQDEWSINSLSKQ